MLSFDKITEDKKLSAKEQLDRIGEMHIYFKYLGFYPEPNVKRKSPFARDSTPSLGFKYYDCLMWRCFSTGKSGNCVNLVAELFNETNKQATIRILNDFSSNPTKSTKIQTTDIFTRCDTEIQVVLQDYSSSDLEYWLQGGIDKDTLDKFNVKVAKEVWLDKGEGFKYIWHYLPKNPIFRYLINGRYKCYRPLEPDKPFKWLGNMTAKDWQGFKELPQSGEVLIVTKSMKDIMVWDKMGYPAISPSSESQVLKPEFFEYFYKKFIKIYLNYDFDEPGMLQASKYNVPHIFTYHQDAKDAFDLVKKIGFENAKDVLINQIK